MNQKASSRHYAKSSGVRIRHPNRPVRQKFPIPAWRFREARMGFGLGVIECADLLRVSERTVRGWESGGTRIPYAAYKLMRLLKSGKVLGPEWRDFFVYRNVLITPEGHQFEAGDLAWWSLLVRRAKAFGELLRAGRGLSAPAAAQVAAGLVCSETSRKPTQVESQKQGVFAPLPGVPTPPRKGPSRGAAGRLARVLRAAGGAR